MEALGAISEGVWSSLSGMYITEEANFMAQLLGKCTFPMSIEDDDGLRNTSWQSRDSSTQSVVGESSFYSIPKMSNYESRTQNLVYFGNSPDVHQSFCLASHTSSMSMDHCINHESTHTLKENHPRIDLEFMTREDRSLFEDDNPSLDGNPKKRSRSNGDDDHHEIKRRNGKAKTTVNISRLSSSPSNSEDDSNGAVTCSRLSPKGTNLLGKTRASRGTATDPQSLYARKRRERINERLRTLQSIVPNGTKVDISTMLEEAVHYVKFLQLQIKLLSSDELWMYAPIAYNGMDINLETSKRR